MENEKFEKYIIKIRNNISNIYNQFYVWKALQNKDYLEVYNRNKYFWGIVAFYSLNRSLLLDLAKLFEKRSEEVKEKYGEGVSIYSLMGFIESPEERKKIEDKIEIHQKTLDNLWERRCKILAHENEEVFLNPEKFYESYPLQWSEIEKLLELAKELIGDIETKVRGRGHVYTYKVFEEESQRDTENIINKLKMAYEIEKEQRKAKYGI